MTERIMRRVTRTRTTPEQAAASRREVEDQLRERLQSIANNNAAIDLAQKQNEDIAAEIERILKDNKMHGFTDGVLMAEFVDVITKSSREVDVKKLWDAMVKRNQKNEFFECVKASMAELKKHLAEKEIDSLSVVTAGKKTGTRLDIKPVKPVTTMKPSRRAK